jgi:hypothetical protein
VEIRWLEGTSSFVAVDFPDAAQGLGIARLAPKVLTDGAELLARSATYAFASFGVQGTGVSVGINAQSDERDAAVAAWRDAVGTCCPEMRLSIDEGRGVAVDDVAPLRALDPRPAALWEAHDGVLGAHRVVAEGVLAALHVTLDGLDGRSLALEDHGPVSAAVASRAEELGATVTRVAAGTDALAGLLVTPVDALVLGSRAGVLDHEDAAQVRARVVVPSGPVPVTTRALAVLRRGGSVVLPDFLTASGSVATLTDDAPASLADLLAHVAVHVGEAVAAVLDHAEGPVVGACERAEAFLATWRDELPFGRPMA